MAELCWFYKMPIEEVREMPMDEIRAFRAVQAELMKNGKW
jgi:hypothetical protein